MLSTLYNRLARHRVLLHVGTWVAIGLSLLAFSRIRMREDIQDMLPDDQSAAAVGFRLLGQTPAARKFLVSLHRTPDVAPEVLAASASRLAAAMKPPYFSRASAGVSPDSGEKFLSWLVRSLPALATEEDRQKLAAGLNPEEVRRRLGEDYSRLLSPEGWAMKRVIQVDPLDFRKVSLQRLRYINLMPNLRLQGDHFISADGLDALILADTPVAVTDSGRADELLAHFAALVRETVPSGITVSFISGHRYTAANAAAVKRDLVVVLTCSSLAILAVYLIYLRSWQALYIFLIPGAVLCLAGLTVSVFYTTVSAITLGFGAVLLGIADDYGIHVYFALRGRPREPATVLKEVSAPILFAGTTILGAFAVLLLSSIPGQRQLAVFSLVGIALSLAVSLVLLPHLLMPSVGEVEAAPRASRSPRRRAFPRVPILGLWLAALVFFGWQCTRARFNADFRALAWMPPELLAAEKAIEAKWGNLRNHAILFAAGPDLASALAANDRVFEFWRDKVPAGQLVSLAPLLPGPATAAANRERWGRFWQQESRRDLPDWVKSEGARLGFAPDAFAPFYALISATPGPTAEDDLRQSGLGEWMESLIVRTTDRVMVMTMVPDTPTTAETFAENADRMPGVLLVSPSVLSQALRQSVGKEFVRLTGLAAAVVIGLLVVLYRDARKVAIALVPLVTALVVTVGALALCHVELTVFNVMAAVLIIGLGVDDGVFMVGEMAQGYDHDTERAMLVASLSTMAGFGGLILARHPALHSIGVTVLLGITAELVTVVFVVPALYRVKGTPEAA